MRLDSYSADGNRFCFGRKCIIVIAEKGDAYILEFKVLNEHREKTVQETAQNALKQIQTRNYEADFLPTASLPITSINSALDFSARKSG